MNPPRPANKLEKHEIFTGIRLSGPSSLSFASGTEEFGNRLSRFVTANSLLAANFER